jgi:hypothetical protein
MVPPRESFPGWVASDGWVVGDKVLADCFLEPAMGPLPSNHDEGGGWMAFRCPSPYWVGWVPRFARPHGDNEHASADWCPLSLLPLEKIDERERRPVAVS